MKGVLEGKTVMKGGRRTTAEAMSDRSRSCTRRGFLGGMTAAALTGFGGTGKRDLIWADLLHFGTHMWGDDGLTPGVHSYSYKAGMKADPIKDKLSFDEGVWKRITSKLAASGGNMVVVDVADAVRCPSCPEIAVSDAWTPERLNAEVRRLKAMGLEPIPKLNFATPHDNWLKIYHRMVGTPKYYKVCAGIIKDVAEIFEKPRFFHIGMDEEDYDQAKGLKSGLGIYRRGGIWWHDIKFYADCISAAGARPWMFSDYIGDGQDRVEEYYKYCPKSIVQSVWYYKSGFDRVKDGDPDGGNWYWKNRLKAFKLIADGGFDQIPCGSTYYTEDNFPKLVEYARRTIPNERILGFLMAPWQFSVPGKCEKDNLKACEVLAAAKGKWEAGA